MKKHIKRITEFFKLIHLRAILLIALLYLLLCLFCYFMLQADGTDTPFWDIVVFNFLAVTGNDYMYVDNPWTRVMGIFVLILGMVGL